MERRWTIGLALALCACRDRPPAPAPPPPDELRPITPTNRAGDPLPWIVEGDTRRLALTGSVMTGQAFAQGAECIADLVILDATHAHVKVSCRRDKTQAEAELVYEDSAEIGWGVQRNGYERVNYVDDERPVTASLTIMATGGDVKVKDETGTLWIHLAVNN